ncbi:methylmalonate-semialdehyde dehydrogenase (CoA acylating), partial [Rhodococcus opacus]
MTHSDGAAQTRTISPSAEGRTISHWFDNKSFAGTSGNTAPVTNPATGAVTGQVALASVEDARAVIAAA